MTARITRLLRCGTGHVYSLFANFACFACKRFLLLLPNYTPTAAGIPRLPRTMFENSRCLVTSHLNYTRGLAQLLPVHYLQTLDIFRVAVVPVDWAVGYGANENIEEWTYMVAAAKADVEG